MLQPENKSKQTSRQFIQILNITSNFKPKIYLHWFRADYFQVPKLSLEN
jgi:hypothetical protein